MSWTTKLKGRGSGGIPAAEPAAERRPWLGTLETVALGVLLVGAAVGLVLWAKWGFLIALQTVAMYCF